MTNEFGLTAPPLADGGCDPRGCYKDEVHYNSTTIDQIEALMEVSSHCQQKIAHNCSVNAIRAGWNIEQIAFFLYYQIFDFKIFIDLFSTKTKSLRLLDRS